MKQPHTHPSQAAIGRALGLSPAAITKLKRQGMPVDSVEAARAWRNANTRPYMRFVTPRQASDPPPLRDADDPRVQAIENLGLAAEQDFARYEVLLRLALAGLPRRLHGAVSLPFGVWDQLHGLELIAEISDPALAGGGDIEEGSEAAEILWDVACGRRVYTGGKP